jgi:type IV pilus assembly protein PilB
MKQRVVTKKIGTLLIENEIITEKQLEEALNRQKEHGGYIGQNLAALGYTSEEEIVSCLTVQYGFPYLPLRNYDVNPEIIRLIPKEVAREYYVIPIDKIGNVLTVTMANPLQEEGIKAIEEVIGCGVEIFVSTGSDIQHCLKEYYGVEADKRDTSQMLAEIDMHKEKSEIAIPKH